MYESQEEYRNISFVFNKELCTSLILFEVYFKPICELFLTKESLRFLQDLFTHVNQHDTTSFLERSEQTRKIMCAVYSLFVKAKFRENKFRKIFNYNLQVLEIVGAGDYDGQKKAIQEALSTCKKVILKENSEKAYMAFGPSFIKSWLGELLSQMSLDENWGDGIGIVVTKYSKNVNNIKKKVTKGKNNMKSKQSKQMVKDIFSVSFRGCTKSKVDLNQIASSYGGGGHEKAAGCSVERLSDLIEYL